ncbi:MAG TPA: Crp/Fnr family transcriptional regulator [Candidatus Binatia bacterium]|jgi:CRP-like cAMP-binding protein|nr:Crp/Fnr family transcriptional regulator [Candidatus Binatia bacterium]
MASGPALAKVTFRALLEQSASRIGLTTAAVEVIVARSQMTHWRAGQRIFAPEDGHDLVHFLVSGVVKVLCDGRRGVPVLVQMVRPGQFFGLASLFDRPGRRHFSAVAHLPAVVAMMSREVIGGVMADLPPGRTLQTMAYSWTALSRLLYEKCLLLTMPLRDRLLHELESLAHDFGQAHPDGTRIDLPLTHADLAALVAGSRAKVSRAVAELRRRGLLDVEGRSYIVKRSAAGQGRSPQRSVVPFGT